MNPDGTFAAKRKSLNHEALGSVGDWMFQAIGSLVPDAAHPGFKHFIIRPIPGGTVTQADMTYQSPHGRIATSWSLKDNRFTLEVEVPVNTTATLVLPTRDAASVTEGGRPVASVPGITSVDLPDGAAGYRVGSGRYTFAISEN